MNNNIGIKFLEKLISLWNNVNLNGLSWTILPKIASYIAKIWLCTNISRFYNLLNPEIEFKIDAGKYDV